MSLKTLAYFGKTKKFNQKMFVNLEFDDYLGLHFIMNFTFVGNVFRCKNPLLCSIGREKSDIDDYSTISDNRGN